MDSPPGGSNFSSSSFVNFASQIIGDIGAPLEEGDHGIQMTHWDEGIDSYPIGQVGEPETHIQLANR